MRILCCLALLACMPTQARASAVVIWPVDPVIREGEQATAVWLENKGAQPVTLQTRSLAWSQPLGEDKLDQQDAVVASPPIVTVAPGARQLVRIIRRAPDTVPEKAYRLLIDELPAPPVPGSAGPLQARLTVQMRYSIPLFTFSGAPAAPMLDADTRISGEGRVLTIRNSGTMHARLTDLRMTADGRASTVKAGLVGYVLPGATISIPLPSDHAGQVTVAVNGSDQVLGAKI